MRVCGGVKNLPDPYEGFTLEGNKHTAKNSRVQLMPLRAGRLFTRFLKPQIYHRTFNAHTAHLAVIGNHSAKCN